MKLTPQQKRDYLACRGVKCPFCESDNLISVKTEWNEPLEIVTRCDACQSQWIDVMTLTDVVDYDE